MPVRGNTFKIFVGNLSDEATSEDLKDLFQSHGTVVEADAIKNYGFVHMQNESEGKAAIEALNGHSLHGMEISVEESTGTKKNSNRRTKIFVGNLHKNTKVEQLKSLFEAYGEVVEADILTNYAFVHMDTESNAQEAIRKLDGSELNGFHIRVQESTSRVRQQAGMGNPDFCFRCGSSGHWAKDCVKDNRFGGRLAHRIGRNGGRLADRVGRTFGGSRFDPYHVPPPTPFSRSPPTPFSRSPPTSFSRERHLQFRDDYEGFGRYDRYDPIYERAYDRADPPPPPMHSDFYQRRISPPLAPFRSDYLHYERRSPLPRYPHPMSNSFRADRRPY